MIKKKKIAITLIAGVMFFVAIALAGGCTLGQGDAGGERSRGGGSIKDDFGGSVISREVFGKDVE